VIHNLDTERSRNIFSIVTGAIVYDNYFSSIAEETISGSNDFRDDASFLAGRTIEMCSIVVLLSVHRQNNDVIQRESRHPFHRSTVHPMPLLLSSSTDIALI